MSSDLQGGMDRFDKVGNSILELVINKERCRWGLGLTGSQVFLELFQS